MFVLIQNLQLQRMVGKEIFIYKIYKNDIETLNMQCSD